MRDVVYACDDNYIEQTVVSMVSLLKRNHCQFKIWIVSDQISRANRRMMEKQAELYGACLKFLDIEQILAGIPVAEGLRHPKTVYAKLFLEKWIPAERLLYLDSDTVVTGNLELLWERSMGKELAAGVRMPYSRKFKEQMGIQADRPFLCDGIVMLNLRLWRESCIGEKCRTYIEKYGGLPPMLSEGTLNYVCQSQIGVLKPEYNLMPSMLQYSSKQIEKLFRASCYYTEEELMTARIKPVIIHFMDELFNRPWLEPCYHPYQAIYREERKNIFGEMPYKKQKLNRATRLTRLLKAILPFPVFAGLYHLKHKDI